MSAMNITSMDIIEKAHRLGFIMDSAGETDDTDTLDQLDKEAMTILQELAEEIPSKLDALRAVWLRLDAEVGLIRQEEKMLASKRRARERGMLRVREFSTSILQGMRDMGEEPKLKTTTNTFWLSQSTSIEGPSDASLWPHRWQRVKIDPDKKSALKALKGGEEVDGFHLVEKEGVSWR